MHDVQTAVEEVAREFARTSLERGQRKALEADDFRALVDAGLHLVAIPEEHGGTWVDLPTSLRPTAQMYLTLAHADPAVALVAAMHPAVLANWTAFPDGDEAWHRQREWVFETVRTGHWWGTVTSEPGSGGDIRNTRARARVEIGRAHV